MRKFLEKVSVVALCMTLVACASVADPEPVVTSPSPEATSQATKAEAPQKLKVAQTVIDLSNVYFVSLSEGVKQACEESGFEYTLNDGKSDAAVQISAIENYIVQGIDVLIVTPVDAVAIESVLQQAKDAGIVIINCNQEVAIKDAFIRIPEYEYGYAAGKIAADWINENIEGEAKIGILNRPVSEPLIQRSNGFKDGVTKNSKAVIVAEQSAHTAELGLKVVESVLQSNPDIDGFVCQNDTAALGAYEALAAAGRDGTNAFVTAVDGLPAAYEKIAEDGIFKGTVNSNPVGMGKLAVETAIKVIESGPIAEEINPEMIPVTKANVAEYMN